MSELIYDEFEMEDSDDEVDDETTLLLAVGAIAGVTYASKHTIKQPCRTSILSGCKWLIEINEGNPKRCYESFRMDKGVFLALCKLLETKYNLCASRHVGVQEQVAIFLWIVGHDVGNREAQERFQHSGETISKYFHNVLDSSLAMSIDWVKTETKSGVHPYVKNNQKYYPHFKDCIGAIDGTHIKACVKPEWKPRFIGRKGYPTQNIMAACDFDLCFTFCLPGWEGSAHDTRIFSDTLRDPHANFRKPIGDEFYLVDSGYSNRNGYLAPYKGERYHLTEFQQGRAPQNAQEKFNYVHSSLRSSIERSFGIWKGRWPLIKDIAPNYSWQTQIKLVCATMAIHNFIRKSKLYDVAFESYDTFSDYVPDDGEDEESRATRHGTCVQNDDNVMDEKRNTICASICRDFRSR